MIESVNTQTGLLDWTDLNIGNLIYYLMLHVGRMDCVAL